MALAFVGYRPHHQAHVVTIPRGQSGPADLVFFFSSSVGGYCGLRNFSCKSLSCQTEEMLSLNNIIILKAQNHQKLPNYSVVRLVYLTKNNTYLCQKKGTQEVKIKSRILKFLIRACGQLKFIKSLMLLSCMYILACVSLIKYFHFILTVERMPLICSSLQCYKSMGTYIGVYDCYLQSQFPLKVA